MPSRKEYPQFYEFTIGYDTARQRLGLPLIKNNLTFKNLAFSCFTDPPSDCSEFVAYDTSIKPRLDLKIVSWDSLGIQLERNYFVGPNNERLQIIYGYKKFLDWNLVGFKYSLTTPFVAELELSKKQTDSILISWDLQKFISSN